MRCQRDLRELKKADALTLISQMETRPQHRRLVAGTRPATTLSPVAYITTDFIGCAHNANGWWSAFVGDCWLVAGTRPATTLRILVLTLPQLPQGYKALNNRWLSAVMWTLTLPQHYRKHYRK